MTVNEEGGSNYKIIDLTELTLSDENKLELNNDTLIFL